MPMQMWQRFDGGVIENWNTVAYILYERKKKFSWQIQNYIKSPNGMLLGCIFFFVKYILILKGAFCRMQNQLVVYLYICERKLATILAIWNPLIFGIGLVSLQSS